MGRRRKSTKYYQRLRWGKTHLVIGHRWKIARIDSRNHKNTTEIYKFGGGRRKFTGAIKIARKTHKITVLVSRIIFSVSRAVFSVSRTVTNVKQQNQMTIILENTSKMARMAIK